MSIINNGFFMEGDTIAGIATAIGGAVGIIRISGDLAAPIVNDLFVPKEKSLLSKRKFESHKFYYGHIKSPGSGAVIDEVLLVLMNAPKTYTREDIAEIHCHGGRESIRRVLSVVLQAGARPAEPGEFTKRAFLNGRIDLTKAEAVMDIVNAVSGRALNVAERALEGRLADKISDFYERIIFEVANIEAALDSPEHAFGEINDMDLSGLKDRLIKIKLDMERLYKTFSYGRILKDGINTVITGRPNVGKSSLLNAMAGHERAIVTNIPGTTRDILTEQITFGESGLVLNVTDTAGIRFSKDVDPVELIGIQKAREAVENTDLIFFVVDGSIKSTAEDICMAKYISRLNKPTICILNKADLPRNEDGAEIIEVLGGIEKVDISAKTQKGFDSLSNAIKKTCLGEISLSDVHEESVILTSIRQAGLLKSSIDGIAGAINTISSGLPEDLVAVELMDASAFLGTITGMNATEDMINSIFSKFCMGK